MSTLRTAPSPTVRKLTIWSGSALAFLGALGASSAVLDLHPAVPTVLAVLVAIIGALQVGLDHYIQSSVVDRGAVVEAVDGGTVKAGPANDLIEEGSTVRTLGYDDGPDCD